MSRYPDDAGVVEDTYLPSLSCHTGSSQLLSEARSVVDYDGRCGDSGKPKSEMHDTTAPLRASVAFQAPRGTQAVNLQRKKKSDAGLQAYSWKRRRDAKLNRRPGQKHVHPTPRGCSSHSNTRSQNSQLSTSVGRSTH